MEYKVFSEECMQALAELKDREEIERTLIEGIEWDDEASLPVLGELLYYTLGFCREHKLKPAQASVVLGIMYQCTYVDAATWNTTCTESYAYASELLLQHAVDHSPASVCLFSEEEVASVSEFLLQHYFRHFRLYKCTLSKRPSLQLSTHEPAGVVGPTPLEPLCRGVQVHSAAPTSALSESKV